MPRISVDDKHARKERILRLLEHHADGLAESEIADTLRLERRSVNNYLTELEQEGKVYKDGKYWYSLPYHKVMPRPLELPPEQAIVLYLAARLFVKQSDRRNETAETVLLKLTQPLSEDVGIHDDIVKAAHELANRPKAPGYEDVFRAIAQSYIYRRQVRVIYQPYRGSPFETTLAPYLLEPSAIGYTTYVIGYSSIVNNLRTYRLDRIHQARLTRDEYTIPADFPGLELLRNAWSIYYGEDTIEVILRFRPEVAKRVRETHWHPSQRITPDDTSPHSICLHIHVADTTDLKPWIRTWGANCEVLAPAELCDEMMGEARRLAELYGWHMHRTADTSNDDDPLGLNKTFGDYFG